MSNGVVLLIALAVTEAAFGQFELGSVQGTLRDQSGLPIANATVEVRSDTTNVARQTTTSAAGEFDFVALQPGPYSLKATQAGFKEQVKKFELTVGQRVELDVAMEIGSSSQSVSVNADALMVETASSEVSNLRTTKQVVDLPLNSRNFTQLVQLAPGVNSHGELD